MKLLLIGHGYLGQAIAREFLSGGWETHTTTLSGDQANQACDVANLADIANLPDADFIIHCASSGRGGADAYQRVYVEGCRNLVHRFPSTPLLYTSSSSVYAQTDGSVVTEDSPTLPDRQTGQFLLAAEQIVQDAGGCITRLAGIYGPNRSVILKKFLQGESVIEEDGRRFLNQIHRDDAARAIFHLAIIRATGIYNLSDSTPLTQLECHQRLSEIFARPLPPYGPRDPDRKRGWSHKQVSNKKIRDTAWQPCYPSFVDFIRPEMAEKWYSVLDG